MTQRVQIIGSYLSPYVRKVLVALDLKGILYSDRDRRTGNAGNLRNDRATSWRHAH
jgi:glutathione S-transferase